jgi:hypothetical protein
MKSFKFEPVRWMTVVLAILSALIASNEVIHLLPDEWVAVMGYTAMVLTLLLGGAVRARVTALAAPRDDAGVPLVPVSMAPPRPR